MEYSVIDWHIVFKWFRNKVNLNYSITFEYKPKTKGNDGKNKVSNRLIDNFGWVYKFKCDLDGVPDYSDMNNWTLTHFEG